MSPDTSSDEDSGDDEFFIPCNSVGNNFKLKEKLFLMIKGKQEINMMKV